MREWETIFKALANINRLKIIRLLSKTTPLDVSTITDRLGISFKATSQHLILLKNVGFLESAGKEGHVLYQIRDQLPDYQARAIKLFL